MVFFSVYSVGVFIQKLLARFFAWLLTTDIQGKNAIKIMKRGGATKEEIEHFKKLNKIALKTHKRTRDLDVLSGLIKKVQIPSRVDQKYITPQTKQEREFYNKHVLKRKKR